MGGGSLRTRTVTFRCGTRPLLPGLTGTRAGPAGALPRTPGLAFGSGLRRSVLGPWTLVEGSRPRCRLARTLARVLGWRLASSRSLRLRQRFRPPSRAGPCGPFGLLAQPAGGVLTLARRTLIATAACLHRSGRGRLSASRFLGLFPGFLLGRSCRLLGCLRLRLLLLHLGQLLKTFHQSAGRRLFAGHALPGIRELLVGLTGLTALGELARRGGTAGRHTCLGGGGRFGRALRRTRSGRGTGFCRRPRSGWFAHRSGGDVARIHLCILAHRPLWTAQPRQKNKAPTFLSGPTTRWFRRYFFGAAFTSAPSGCWQAMQSSKCALIASGSFTFLSFQRLSGAPSVWCMTPPELEKLVGETYSVVAAASPILRSGTSSQI